jgi:hypothetical protein
LTTFLVPAAGSVQEVFLCLFFKEIIIINIEQNEVEESFIFNLAKSVKKELRLCLREFVSEAFLVNIFPEFNAFSQTRH